MFKIILGRKKFPLSILQGLASSLTQISAYILRGKYQLFGSSAAPWHADSKAAGREKVLEMSVTILHSKCRPVQTIRLGLLPIWRYTSQAPTQEFPASWDQTFRFRILN